MKPSIRSTARVRITAALCIVAALLSVPCSLFAGDLGPVIHFWAVGTESSAFGAIVFSDDTYLVCGPVSQHFAVTAAAVERFSFFAGLVLASLVALAVIYFRRRNRKHHATGMA
jgi:hypothetical protein